MRYEIGQVNRLGNRTSNQDRFMAVETDEGVLLVLGDGMGGQACGEVAAQQLIDTASRLYLDSIRPIEDAEAFFRRVILGAHKSIVEFGQRQEPPLIPGTTGVLCLIQDGLASWAHVGDSRLYVFHDGIPIYRTTDHSYVEELYQRGEITRWEQENHPRRNQITQCLGCRELPPEISYNNAVTLRRNDIVLLCSDGLWGPLDDALIGTMMRGDNGLEELLNTMAEKAEHLSYPRCDNISGLALRFISNEPDESQDGEEKSLGRDEVNDLESAIAKIEEVIREYEKEIDG